MLNTDPAYLTFRIRVGRSIDGFGLSPGITREQRLQLEGIFKKALECLPGEISGTYYPLATMNEKVRQQLIDEHLLFVSGDPNLFKPERFHPLGQFVILKSILSPINLHNNVNNSLNFTCMPPFPCYLLFLDLINNTSPYASTTTHKIVLTPSV
ncbi:unnamed protein product, partial [Meganyctiphanes norvegica]